MAYNVFNPLQCLKGKKGKFAPEILNSQTFIDYFTRLEELAINMFDWSNLPDTVDERFLELTLFEKGFAVYFNDEILGDLALPCMIGGKLNVYRIPTYRRAYATNGYQKVLGESDSVIIFNNRLHQPLVFTIALFASRLTEIQRAIDINVKGQKHPIAILCDEHERLSYENIYYKYDANHPLFLGTKNLDLDNIKALNTESPYVADKLFNLKRQVWNEALTLLGISNASSEKRERLISDEVVTNMGGIEAQRYTMLNERRTAAEKINKMFGTNIEVNYRQELSPFNMYEPTTTTMDNGQIDESEVTDNVELYD